MSDHRQNLSVWVDETSPLHRNRVARVVQVPTVGIYESPRTNNHSQRTGDSTKFQKTPSGTLFTFQGSPVQGLAETFEHPDHVPVFLEFDSHSESVHHIDREVAQNRLDNTRRKGSLLPDDEYEAIRMTFPARTPETTPRLVTCELPTVVLTPPPRTPATLPRRSGGHLSPRPRGPRAPSRVASSAQLRTASVQPPVQHPLKPAEKNPGVFVPRRLPILPGTFNQVFAGDEYGVIHERHDANPSNAGVGQDDSKGKGKVRSFFKKRN